MSDTAHTQTIQPTPEQPVAALACSLEGGYLIEASAGTGKTWTLTGIILRLLIEKQYAPERIVATTFTRAAAAEMQERIGERLQDFYALIRWLKSTQTTQPQWFSGENIGEYLTQITQAACQINLAAEDPINQHLLEFLLVQMRQQPQILDKTLHRTATLLTTMDKLFVGTLDSLAQKWLKEFSAQIGHQSQAEIMESADEEVTALVHDALRAKEAFLKYQNPWLYQAIKTQKANFFSDVGAMIDIVKNALQFFTAEIDAVTVDETRIDALKAQLAQVQKADFTEFLRYTDAEYCAQNNISRSLGTLPKLLENLESLLVLMDEYGVMFFLYLTSAQEKLLIKAMEFEDSKNFKRGCTDEQKQAFIALDWSLFEQIHHIKVAAERFFEQFYAAIYREIALMLRKKVASNLEAQAKTTFTLQMVRLNDALQDMNLARHIRHHYPVALIDESQDLNGLQADMLERIYLQPLAEYQKRKNAQHAHAKTIKPPKGFLLLVGDPKQAIYRFRGGDVSNYNFLKFYGKAAFGEPILNSQLTLDVNRRSNAALVNALNTWFIKGDTADFSNHAYLGTQIYYQQITAAKQTQELSWQQAQAPKTSHLGSCALSFLHFTYKQKSQKDALIAKHINSLLQGGQTIFGRKILPSDIAILTQQKKAVTAIIEHLKALNIPVSFAQEQSVFHTQAAQDLYCLFEAIIYPQSVSKLSALLVSSLFAMTLNEALACLQGADNAESGEISETTVQKTQLLSYLKKIHEKWQKQGLSAALNFAFAHAPTKHQKNLWLMAARYGERYVMDLTQIMECLNATHQMHELQLLRWYRQQMACEEVPEAHIARAIADDSAVSVMTIHRSKGLEFPIVYVLGLDDARRSDADQLFAYSDDNFKRRLSAVPSKAGNPSYYSDLETQESTEERRRLAYVALTRASEQLFVIATDSYNKSLIDKKPLYQWLENTADSALSLAERLQTQADWIELAACESLCDTPLTHQQDSSQPIEYQAWTQLMQQQEFQGYYKTSFTALVNRLDRSTQALHVNQPDYDDVAQLVDTLDFEPKAITDDIRATFMRGIGAGDFLHKVLEFSENDDALSAVIDEQIRRLGLPMKYASKLAQSLDFGASSAMAQQLMDETLHQQLIDWLSQVRHSAFAASGVCLADLDKRHQVRELSFTLGLSEQFCIDNINAAFAKYSDKNLNLLDDPNHQVWYRYLRGEIDLVYEWQGKFYIVDYKSNHLGETLDAYQEDALIQAMDKAGYWLQAAIYQVALHRLLKLRVPDYVGNETKYLGGVEYFFLRGITQENRSLGRLVWQVPLALIFALDEIF